MQQNIFEQAVNNWNSNPTLRQQFGNDFNEYYAHLQQQHSQQFPPPPPQQPIQQWNWNNQPQNQNWQGQQQPSQQVPPMPPYNGQGYDENQNFWMQGNQNQPQQQQPIQPLTDWQQTQGQQPPQQPNWQHGQPVQQPNQPPKVGNRPPRIGFNVPANHYPAQASSSTSLAGLQAQFGGMQQSDDDVVKPVVQPAPSPTADESSIMSPVSALTGIFRQAVEVDPDDVRGSIFDVIIRFFVSFLMIIVDWITNIGFLANPSKGVFEALGSANFWHYAGGASFIFSEYLALSYTSHIRKKGWKNASIMEYIFVISLWIVVGLNFLATWRPVYNMNIGGEPIIAFVAASAVAVIVTFFSERFPTHCVQLWASFRQK